MTAMSQASKGPGDRAMNVATSAGIRKQNR
jgi:hypothetical protein